MTGLQQRLSLAWRGCVRWAVATLLLGSGAHAAQQGSAGSAREWQKAVAARDAFESEPAGKHTKAEYTAVMDGFRAIYHTDPASQYAPKAVDAVAELLAEQGHELKDRKSLRDAAGQYEFLAKGYPQSTLAGVGLGKAFHLLGPDAADDAAEARKVRALLETQYPHSAAARAALNAGPFVTEQVSPSAQQRVQPPTTEADPARAEKLGRAAVKEGRVPEKEDAQGAETTAPALDEVDNQRHLPGAAPAMVTGIRHWSTASYTRVAIDLGGEVEFQAARVEHPDRIFFDLHGAKLAPGLAGKTFTITDDGFLKAVRAGQFGVDVTRVVLDVQPVAEYSAFLLPNPTRLIIDIHGKQAADAAKPPRADLEARAGTAEPDEADDNEAAGDKHEPAPVERIPAATTRVAKASSLPPMPVTDGSAGFGLPPKRDQAVVAGTAVARPRVVVPAKPTTAKPVPNSVTSTTPVLNRDVAAVSEGPGVIAATEKPTSKPVVDTSSRPGHSSKRAATSVEDAAEPVAPPPPTAEGQSTLMRALGLKIGRIVIDAGHGGHDSGTLGPGGIEEKDVVLDVALRLGKLLHDRLGAEVVYTRADDTFIPLETRTAIANKAQADLFISVHANSSQDASARGVEVYYLNFTSDPEAMQVAGRENAVSSQRVNQLSDLVKKIALKDKIDESRELAGDVDTSLYAGLRKGNEGLKDRGVKKAPFVVLIGANMPSILAEISFVTNPHDADELRRPEYRERVAESLYGGVAQYASTINHGTAGKKTKATERAQR